MTPQETLQDEISQAIEQLQVYCYDYALEPHQVLRIWGSGMSVEEAIDSFPQVNEAETSCCDAVSPSGWKSGDH